MISINKVIPSQSVAGGADVLQPAAPLSEEVRRQLFDEFTPRGTPAEQGVASSTIVGALLVAAALSAAALFILKNVQPYENTGHSSR